VRHRTRRVGGHGFADGLRNGREEPGARANALRRFSPGGHVHLLIDTPERSVHVVDRERRGREDPGRLPRCSTSTHAAAHRVELGSRGSVALCRRLRVIRAVCGPHQQCEHRALAVTHLLGDVAPPVEAARRSYRVRPGEQFVAARSIGADPPRDSGEPDVFAGDPEEHGSDGAGQLVPMYTEPGGRRQRGSSRRHVLPERQRDQHDSRS
jgi:hypothetical protein